MSTSLYVAWRIVAWVTVVCVLLVIGAGVLAWLAVVWTVAAVRWLHNDWVTHVGRRHERR